MRRYFLQPLTLCMVSVLLLFWHRDAVNMMLSSVRECTADIQVAVDAVKGKIQQGIECSESTLTQALHQSMKKCFM